MTIEYPVRGLLISGGILLKLDVYGLLCVAYILFWTSFNIFTGMHFNYLLYSTTAYEALWPPSK